MPTPTVIIVALNPDSGLRTNTSRPSPFFIAHGVIVQVIISKCALFYRFSGWVNLIFTALKGLSPLVYIRLGLCGDPSRSAKCKMGLLRVDTGGYMKSLIPEISTLSSLGVSSGFLD